MSEYRIQFKRQTDTTHSYRVVADNEEEAISIATKELHEFVKDRKGTSKDWYCSSAKEIKDVV